MPQSVVNPGLAFGIPGEAFLEGATDAAPWIMESSAIPNIVGATAYTYTSDGIAAAGGTGQFVGILANPKVYATAGVAGNALGATMTLPNETVGELVTFHPGLIVKLAEAGAVGNLIYFTQATGVLHSMVPTGTLPGASTLIAGAKIVRFAVDSGGLAVISLGHG